MSGARDSTASPGANVQFELLNNSKQWKVSPHGVRAACCSCTVSLWIELCERGRVGFFSWAAFATPPVGAPYRSDGGGARGSWGRQKWGAMTERTLLFGFGTASRGLSLGTL